MVRGVVPRSHIHVWFRGGWSSPERGSSGPEQAGDGSHGAQLTLAPTLRDWAGPPLADMGIPGVCFELVESPGLGPVALGGGVGLVTG